MSSLKSIHRARPAMGTLFEAWLIGDDDEHLTAVAEVALDEITRLERLLSRFDPRSEMARINRLAAAEEVLVDREMFDILATCHRWWRTTDGYYDIAAANGTFDAVVLNVPQRTVRFTQSGVMLDLGGFGKGYALDRAGEILREQGVTRAILHGGTSSILACGFAANGQPWPIGIRNPFAADEAPELCQLRLTDCGLATSAVLNPGQQVSDIIDPQTGQAIAEQAACVVVAPTAVDSEILSTALLSMGRDRARAYTERHAAPGCSVSWIDSRDGVATLDWLCNSP